MLNDVLKFSNSFSVLIKSKKCVVGTDTRLSRNIIAETVKAGLMQCGVDIYNLGVVPTPVVFRESQKYGAGIVVTASHNPTEWNGLKMLIDGKGINQEQLDLITNEQVTNKSKIGLENNINSAYVDEAAQIIGKVSDNPKVIVDVGGGSAKNIASSLLQKIGCDVITINNDLEKSSRGPDPTSDPLDELVSKSKNVDIGFAFDLDADRLVVVKNGKKLSSDSTLGLGVAKALELGCKNFVLSQDTSISIEKYIKKKGGTVFRSKVGEVNVIEKIVETQSCAGGEGSSGGFIFPDFNFCRDGILTSGLIVSLMRKDEFSDVLNLMEKYHQIREKIEVGLEYQEKILKNLFDVLKEKYRNLQTLDGIKVIVDEDSWFLIRKSNTENIIRISTESNSLEDARNIHLQTKELVKQSYEQIK
uniref:Phosphoglucomutase/phosphomannomutase (Pmm-pgm) n=1 Tax=uncultured marine thaumarchaeote SAT1000_48_C08 TaxID=1456415 RepID=A0A075IE92_9ARCH|nr:phosphoglucomutase/phosphomannomutase (pmm-pgm) [uncultured marine thaumarchaeote SAT1000_48_C08]